MRYDAGLVVTQRFPLGISPLDYTLELEIDAAWHALVTHPEPKIKRLACARMNFLIAQRSQSRVAQMEREQGLR